MKRIAVLDIKNQDIGLNILFPEADYYTIYDELNKDLNLRKYNINKSYNIDNITDNNYDYLFIIISFLNIIENHDNDKDFKNGFNKALEIIDKNNFKKVIVFDNYDYDYDPNDFIKNNKIDYYFKRNYSKTKIYKRNVIPFSFIMFGQYSIVETIDNCRNLAIESPNFKNRVFFSGTLLDHKDNEMKVYRNRNIIFNQIKNNVTYASNLDYYLYLDIINTSKYSLDLNGVGDPNKRTFEILAQGSLRLGEYNDFKWCFNEEFAEETIFKTGEEFERKLFNLENDPDLYNKCLNRQYELFNKYFNKEWIRSYIENYLD